MDGIAPNNEAFNSLCSRVSLDDYDAYYASFDNERIMKFQDNCAECFRSAVQLLEEGFLNESEYRYIVGMAFTSQHKIIYYAENY